MCSVAPLGASTVTAFFNPTKNKQYLFKSGQLGAAPRSPAAASGPLDVTNAFPTTANLKQRGVRGGSRRDDVNQRGQHQHRRRSGQRLYYTTLRARRW